MKAIVDLQPGDHLCWSYEADEERRAVLSPFVRAGLDRREKLLYVGDARSRETILGYLSDDGFDPQPYLAQGQLAFLTCNDTYLRKGVFDPDAMIALLRTETLRALEEGYTALRVTGEMTWAFIGSPGCERLVEYEARLRDFFPNSFCLAICQYDARRIEPTLLLEVLQSHPWVIIDASAYDNPYYIRDRHDPGRRPEVALRHLLRQIAEATRNELALREQFRLLHSVFSSAPGLFVLKGPNSVYRMVNPAFCRFLGRPEQEIVGKSDFDLFPRCEAEMFSRDDARMMETGEPQVQAEQVTGTAGKRWFHVSRTPVRDEAGTITDILCTLQDVTEQRQIEESLRDSEAKFRAIFEQAPDSILMIDAVTRELTNFNAQAHQMLGYTANEFRMLKLDDIEACESPQEVAAHIARVKESGHDSFETKHRHKNGAVIDVLVRTRLVVLQNRPFFVSIVADITERKIAETEREMTIDLLRIVRDARDRQELLRSVVNLLRTSFECDSVGIRLADGEDFPYFEARGFSPDFIEIENRLCAVDWRGERLRDSQGNPVLECMCGNVICGRFDPSKPYFTEKGSFWTNSTSELLASTTEADRQARTRNRCNGEGYESVALIPICTSEKCIGLLQLNDHQRGRFSRQAISFLERAADNLAMGLERLGIQQSLQDRTERLSTAVRGGNVGLWDWDLRSNRVFYSPEWKRQIGHEDHEISDDFSEWRDRVHPDDIERCLQSVYAFIERPWPDFQLEFRFRHKEGTYRWIQARASTIEDQQGNAVRMVGSHVDVTDGKRNEQKMRQESAMRSILLENLPCMAMILRKETREIVYSNLRAREVGAVPGKTCYETCADREDACPFCLASLVWRTDTPQQAAVEYRGRHYEGLWIPLDDDFYVHYVYDVTEQKRTEVALRQSERMQAEAERIAAQGRMAARIAHEISNPLSGIRNAFLLVRDAVPADHPDRDMVERIDREIDRISGVVQQMYSLYRHQVARLEDVDVAAAVGDVLVMLEPLRREREAEFDAAEIPNGLTLRLAAGGLQQVLFNLVANSLEASPQGCKVSIAASLCDGNAVEITVLDQGCGIPLEIQNRVFEPFFTTKASFHDTGLGLGLSVVKSVVEAHSGRVVVQSMPGHGTAVRVIFPRNSKEGTLR